MIWLAILLQAAPAPPPITRSQQMSDKQACALFRKISDGVIAESPMMVDAVTRIDGMSVVCSLRTVAWNKLVTLDASQFRDGWRERKQAQFNDIICKNEAFLPLWRRGWRFVQNLTFLSGERVIMDAKRESL